MKPKSIYLYVHDLYSLSWCGRVTTCATVKRVDKIVLFDLPFLFLCLGISFLLTEVCKLAKPEVDTETTSCLPTVVSCFDSFGEKNGTREGLKNLKTRTDDGCLQNGRSRGNCHMSR